MLNEFKKFLLRGNIIDLAVAVIIGAAFTKVVTSFTADILMPPLGMILGQVNFSELFVALNGGNYATLAEAQKAGAPTINYGIFINVLIDFTILAGAIFALLKVLARTTGMNLLNKDEKK